MVSKHAFKKLDSNEEEFDRTYIKLDTLFESKVPLNTDKDLFRKYLNKLNKLYTDTSLSAQIAYENLSRFEAREIVLVSDLETAVAGKSFSDKEVEYLLLELHNLQLKLSSTNGSNAAAENVKRSLEKQQEDRKSQFFLGDRMLTAISILTKESQELKSYISSLQDELYSTRMAVKYLYKELAGRIQQIQLLCQKMDGPQQEKLWNTLESEILLCRHKTVNLSCRNRLDPPPLVEKANDPMRYSAVYSSNLDESFKSSAPSKQEFKEKEGKLEFDLLFLHDDSLDEISQICIDNKGRKFRLYDENQVLPSHFLFQVHQQLKENHSVTDNKISEPRPVMELVSEYRRFLEARDATCHKITESNIPLKNGNNSEEFLSIYESYLWRSNGLEGPVYSNRLPEVEKKLLNEVHLPQFLPLSNGRNLLFLQDEMKIS
nr:Golgi associated PDZ and coiled coil [Hymenolepis microstoma]